ncbi:glycosyltransferase family A protein [Alphaproteobacteria bacterium]|nr:glycosyltransferase family A protein [Alphaproteobacteria bacterium]|tara:strand:- start:823 stop:1692 length:870 start_codon:yes stop_codon:yes gene_type:complete
MKAQKSLETVSVVIPTLNRCLLLKRAIDSVLNQSVSPNEVIVIDNGSSDETINMISTNYPDIIFLTEEKIGVSASRNQGIKKSNSEWVAFLDSDDVWEPFKLEKQLTFNNRFKTNFRFIHTNETWIRNGKFLNQMKKHEKSGGDLFKNCLKLCCISPSSSMIKKEVFKDYGFFDEELQVCEDYDMWVRITAKENVGYLSEPLVIKYGGHADQLSKKYWGMDRFRIKSLEKNINSNWFSKDQNKYAYETLIKKLQIVLSGAKNRNNTKLSNIYSEKLGFWQSCSNSINYD